MRRVLQTPPVPSEMEGNGVRKFLRKHARTFALTLRMLPGALREPLSIAYLLARASDTIADAAGISREKRLKILETLSGNLNEGKFGDWPLETGLGKLSFPEQELIAAVPSLFVALEQLPDYGTMLRLWRTILEGQLFDLRRFPSAEPLSRQELERYCWLVGGSVGEAWTELIGKHAPRVLLNFSEDARGMRALGASYGKGLQLVNILRDRRADRALGRIYASEEEIPELLPLVNSWLHQGEIYLSRLKPGRIRLASEIPLRLAQRTLELMRKSPQAAKVKMKRWQVYAILLRSLPSLVLRDGFNPA